MSIIRAKRERNYSVISNSVYKDKQLSFQAMGMLSYILSKPDNWSISPSQLEKVTVGTAKKTGRDGIYSILKELKGKGFISTRKNSDGTLDYTVFDNPVTDKPDTDNTDKANPHTDKPDQANPDLAETTLISTDLVTSTDDLTNIKSKQKSSGLDFSSWPSEPSEQIFKDWKAMRDKKRAPVTQTVINRLASKLVAAGKQFGMSVDDVLGLCVERGWQGFEIEWLANVNRGKPQGVNYVGSDFTGPKGWEEFK
ncbi:hypothetical protein KW453_15900 [Vibrio fluvialis]|nr:hypothetical protein [Vibrio fluvialis]MBY7979267.1 hypothetical protein [Vibrio fluvialis]